MKLSEPTELMDMTNIIREYINRKKPVRKQMSKNNMPSIVVDLEEKKRASSTFKSYETLQVKPRTQVRERLMSKELLRNKSREASKSTNHHIRMHLESHVETENQPQTEKQI